MEEATRIRLIDYWRRKAADSKEEAVRIRNTIKVPSKAEERCDVRAEVWNQCANELEQAVNGGD